MATAKARALLCTENCGLMQNLLEDDSQRPTYLIRPGDVAVLPVLLSTPRRVRAVGRPGGSLAFGDHLGDARARCSTLWRSTALATDPQLLASLCGRLWRFPHLCLCSALVPLRSVSLLDHSPDQKTFPDTPASTRLTRTVLAGVAEIAPLLKSRYRCFQTHFAILASTPISQIGSQAKN